ncbi:MAG: enoyl-CoA hydratase/isomerase family protein [Candidatus Thorarchaeota archaeon]|nr:enoyl-CoA hydratase/isomerase family protein [Candidatus Thorarchaeota archaeon]
MNGEIRVETKNQIAIVTISRPEKLNSVTKEMLVSFEERVAGLLNDKEVVAIVFTGAGERAFSAGFDMEMVRGLSGEARQGFFKLLEETIRMIRFARNSITVAAVNGYAIGFGAMLASACDFRFFTDNAAFRLPEVDLSIFPGSGATSNLVQLVGPARAKDILLTGRTVTAEEALRIGIADRVVAQRDLMQNVLEFITGILAKDRKIVIRTKTLVDGITGEKLTDAAEMESVFQEEWLLESGEDIRRRQKQG